MRAITTLVGLLCFGLLSMGSPGCKGAEGEPCQTTTDCKGDLVCCFDIDDPSQELGECRPTSQCRPCGNGVIDEGEECDDGNVADGDGCTDCTVDPECGNGDVEGDEECDDGNTSNGDGCSSNCAIEPECGDGDVEEGEECDDGNTVSGDGCSDACVLEVVPGCGNGVLEAGEQCDGSVDPSDGCEAAGYLSGEVICDNNCELDTSDCMNHPDLVAWYRLDANTGLVADSGIWSNDCVDEGTVRDATGVVGRAATFNGTSAYVDCGTGTNLDGMLSLTVETWVYLSSYSGESMFVSRAASGDATGLVYALGVAGGASWGANQNHAFFATEDLASAVFSADPLPLDAWHHVAGVYKAGELTIYVDGAAVGAASLTTTSLPSPDGARLYLGHLYDGSGVSTWDTHLDGSLDDVRIWRTARDAPSICTDAGGTVDATGDCQI